MEGQFRLKLLSFNYLHLESARTVEPQVNPTGTLFANPFEMALQALEVNLWQIPWITLR